MNSLDHEGLLAEVRRKARIDADNLWPSSAPHMREEFRRWLVIKNYLACISPVVVDEAQDPP